MRDGSTLPLPGDSVATNDGELQDSGGIPIELHRYRSKLPEARNF
jgi:hypothetical protein